jgi:hypothetical protein
MVTGSSEGNLMLFRTQENRDPDVETAIKETNEKLRVNERLQREVAAIAKELKRRDPGDSRRGSTFRS